MTEFVVNSYRTNKQNYLTLRANLVGGASDFTFTSPDISNNVPINREFTQYGANKQPFFEWHNVPSNTIELVLVCSDPDAKGNIDAEGKVLPWIHWFIFKISPETTSTLDTYKMTIGQNSSGKTEYAGPHPPDDIPHRYYFELYALSSDTEFNDFTKYEYKEIINEISRAGKIALKSIMGTFQKPARIGRSKKAKKSKKSNTSKLTGEH